MRFCLASILVGAKRRLGSQPGGGDCARADNQRRGPLPRLVQERAVEAGCIPTHGAGGLEWLSPNQAYRSGCDAVSSPAAKTSRKKPARHDSDISSKHLQAEIQFHSNE